MIRWYDYFVIAITSVLIFPFAMIILPPIINLNAVFPLYAFWWFWEMYCDKRQSIENV
jgi:hypothetical protein